MSCRPIHAGYLHKVLCVSELQRTERNVHATLDQSTTQDESTTQDCAGTHQAEAQPLMQTSCSPKTARGLNRKTHPESLLSGFVVEIVGVEPDILAYFKICLYY